MPRHDPIPPSVQRAAAAWARYKQIMSWMAIAAVVAVLLALIWLRSTGVTMPVHMVIATVAGVGLSVLLGTGLMGLAYFSSISGHDEEASSSDEYRN
jgi:archaellum biogenesis protein FlaJ (TadC family)